MWIPSANYSSTWKAPSKADNMIIHPTAQVQPPLAHARGSQSVLFEGPDREGAEAPVTRRKPHLFTETSDRGATVRERLLTRAPLFRVSRRCSSQADPFSYTSSPEPTHV